MDFRKKQGVTVRGLRNNNPFNIVKTADKWQGKTEGSDPKFETFSEIEYGIRAGIIDIVGDICKDGKNTLEKLFKEFAPKTENNTAAYIDFVSKKIGKKPGEKLTDENGKISFDLLLNLAQAINEKENGSQARLLTLPILKAGVIMGANAPQISKFVTGAPYSPEKGKNLIVKDIAPLFFVLIVAGIILSTIIK